MEAEREKVSSEAEISFYREMIRLMETETYLKNDARRPRKVAAAATVMLKCSLWVAIAAAFCCCCCFSLLKNEI